MRFRGTVEFELCLPASPLCHASVSRGIIKQQRPDMIKTSPTHCTLSYTQCQVDFGHGRNVPFCCFKVFEKSTDTNNIFFFIIGSKPDQIIYVFIYVM